MCRFLLFLVLFATKITAQDNFGVKFFGLSIHPKGEKENAHLMPHKFDKNAYFVMNFGAEIMFEKFVFEDIFSVKIIQAMYSDCAEQLGGFSHIGVRGRIFKKERHSLYGGIGPTFVYRKNWLKLPDYQNPNFFKGDENADFQYLFLWYGGEFEYKYRCTEKVDFAVSFVPGYPDLISLAIGVSYRF